MRDEVDALRVDLNENEAGPYLYPLNPLYTPENPGYFPILYSGGGNYIPQNRANRRVYGHQQYKGFH